MRSRKIYLAAAAALMVFSVRSLAGGYVSIYQQDFGDPKAPYGHVGPYDRPVFQCEEAYIKVNYKSCQQFMARSQSILDGLNRRNPGPPESWSSQDLSEAREEQRDIATLRAFCRRAKKQLDYLEANPDRRC